jgi:CRP/FNR family cyclic AMP-dependent transcriptional regulator
MRLASESGREGVERADLFDDGVATQAALSAALVTILRGKFCDVILLDRQPLSFAKGDVIYTAGDKERTLFFLKGGDVVGELCAAESERPDRAVALEPTEAIPVPFEDVKSLLMSEPRLVTALLDTVCAALKQAYAQINTLANDDTIHRIAKTLMNLARKIGRPAGSLVEIPTYLTQEEIAQMAASRRERVSTGLNFLRRQGMVQYTNRGHLQLDMSALEKLAVS